MSRILLQINMFNTNTHILPLCMKINAELTILDTKVPKKLHFGKHNNWYNDKGGTTLPLCDWTEPMSLVTVKCHLLFLLCTSLNHSSNSLKCTVRVSWDIIIIQVGLYEALIHSRWWSACTQFGETAVVQV